jgi:tetratricopeptide (TPR) repeat protein
MPARATLLFLTGLAIGSAVGCATLPSLSWPPTGDGASARAEAKASKRQPLPATCVAFGELHESAAADPGRSSAEQEQLRNKARLAYQQALQASPNDLPALLALAQLYTSEGDYERALATYDRAIAAHPKDSKVRYELGMCHARRKKWDLALASLQKALELDPENPSYRHTYGLCLARAGHLDESFKVLAKLEGVAEAHYDLARMLHHLDQDQASKEHLRRALAQKPEHLEAQQLLEELESKAADPSSYPSTPAAAETARFRRP